MRISLPRKFNYRKWLLQKQRKTLHIWLRIFFLLDENGSVHHIKSKLLTPTNHHFFDDNVPLFNNRKMSKCVFKCCCCWIKTSKIYTKINAKHNIIHMDCDWIHRFLSTIRHDTVVKVEMKMNSMLDYMSTWFNYNWIISTATATTITTTSSTILFCVIDWNEIHKLLYSYSENRENHSSFLVSKSMGKTGEMYIVPLYTILRAWACVRVFSLSTVSTPYRISNISL